MSELSRTHRASSELARFGERANDGIRTRDLLITNQLLYQLSYIGVSPGSVSDKRGKTLLPSRPVGN